MINSSDNITAGLVEKRAIFSYFSFFSTLFLLLPVFIVNTVLLVAIVTEKKLPVTIRWILSNIVIASQVVNIGLCFVNLHSIIPSLPPFPPPSSFVCRLSFVVINTGAAGRLLYMATYGVTVYALARYSGAKLKEAHIKFLPALISVVIIWIVSSLPSMALFSSIFLDVSFNFVDDCIAQSAGNATLVYSFLYIFLYGLCSYVASIVFPLLTMRYVKTHQISYNRSAFKGMIIFSAFLLIGNSINMVGVSVPILIATFAPPGNENQALVIALNYVEGVCLQLSLIPSPIVIFLFFKPVREKMRKIMCFMCKRVATETRSYMAKSATSDTSL